MLSCLLFLLGIVPVISQSNLDQPVPVDEKVRIGKLENGMTYYIRKNEKPEKRVEMRLAVNAGSVLEEEDQRGLAHFVEHMAFNGTKNFAKNDLIHYMQSIGSRFGPEVNAGTSFAQTVYMLTLPTDSAGVVEKGFQIMEDWAHNITFDPVEIDKERGIIVEEWRLYQGLSERLNNRMFPVLFEGSQYGQRIPLGKKEVIEGAPYEKIRKFYTDWYRPNLMAFIIVGDIDPDAMEKLIISHFNGIKNPEPERVRNRFEIPDKPGISTLIMADKEMPVVQIAMLCRVNPTVADKQSDFRKLLGIRLIGGMLTQRYNDLREKADAPILGGQASYEPLFPEKSLVQLAVATNENSVDKGLDALIAEAERVLRFGFTEGELKRQKKELLTMYENAYNERDKTNSESLAGEYVRNFTLKECIPGIEFEYNFAKDNLGGITVEEVNAWSKELYTNDNRVLILLGPEKEGFKLPSDKEVLDRINAVVASDIKPYEDKITGDQLIEDMPAKGRILLARKNEKLGTVEMKLSNGAKVVLKPTDFKNDQILFGAYSSGGYSVYEMGDHFSAYLCDDLISQFGVGNYSLNDLTKMMAGKTVSLTPYIDEYYEGVNGSASPRDLESMFQLNYLYFTQPRKDSAMYVSLMKMQKDFFKNSLSSPETYFRDQFIQATTQNNRRADVIPTEKEMESVNLNRMMEIYRDRFSDASDFTFFLVGSFKVDSIKPFIENYLASLPSTRRQESWKDMGIRPPSKKTDVSAYKGTDPKSLLGLSFEMPTEWSFKADYDFESLSQLLEVRYLDVIREELSGAYTMSTSGNVGKIPYSRYSVKVVVPCSPDNVSTITKAALNEIKTIQVSGVKPEDLAKVREAQKRDLEKNLKENSFWLSELMKGYRYDYPELILDYDKWNRELTSDVIRNAANQINLKNYVRVALYPEKPKK